MKKLILALILAPSLLFTSLNNNSSLNLSFNIKQAASEGTVNSVSINSINLAQNEKDVQIKYSIYTSDNTNTTLTAVKFSSSDDTIVKVDITGKLTSFAKTGTATITITSVFDSTKTATANVEVKDVSKFDFKSGTIKLTNAYTEDSNNQVVYTNGVIKHVAASTKTFFVKGDITNVKDDKGQVVSKWSNDSHFLDADVTISSDNGTSLKSTIRDYDRNIDGDLEGLENEGVKVIELKGDQKIIVTATSKFNKDLKSSFILDIKGYEGTKVVDDSLTTILDDSQLTTDQDQKLSYDANTNFSKFFFSNSKIQRLRIGKDVNSFDPVSLSTARQLEEIIVDEGNSSFMSINGVLYSKDGNSKPNELLFYPIGKQDTSFTTPEGCQRIGEYAISRQRYLTELILSEGVNDLGNYAFFNSTSIKKWSIPTSLDANKLTGRDSTAFTNGSAISELYVTNTDYIENIISANMYSTFFDKVNKVEFAEGITSISTKVLHTFTNAIEMIIPSTVTKLGDSKDGTAFSFVPKLKKLTISENNPVYKTDGFAVWTKKDATLRTMVVGNDSPYLGEKNYYETPSEVTTFAPYSLILGSNIKKLKINKAVTKIEPNALIESESATKGNTGDANIDMGLSNVPTSVLEYIDVDKDNPNFTSLQGILFSKDASELIKFPCKFNLANLFGNSKATYKATKEEVDQYVQEDGANVDRFFNKMYAIPSSVKKIASLAFNKTSSSNSLLDESSTIQFLYFPRFEYTKENESTSNYINDHIIKFEKNAFGFKYSDSIGGIELYFGQGQADYYLHKYDANNKQVKENDAPVYSDNLKNIYLLEESNGNLTPADKLKYFNEYSSSTNKDGDPFMVAKGFSYMKDPSKSYK